ncbi:helix-turn-helix domain-containing protein [Enterococcus sp. LJL99]
MLGIERYLNSKNPQLLIPQYSTLAVSIQREKMEKIRKEKGIPIRVLEKKINLSKSRYYRWLQYETDLPIELIVSLKKLLNLTDYEFLKLFSNSTDEQIQMLSLVIYLSQSKDIEENKVFFVLKEKLEKYRISQIGNIPYKLILYYSDLWLACYRNEETNSYIKQLETYFLETDYFTLFDIFLYLAVLIIEIDFSIEATFLTKATFFFEKELLRKLSEDNLGEWADILIGCILDLSFFYWKKEQKENAYILVKKATEILVLSKQLDRYNQALLTFVCDIFSQKEESNVKKRIDMFKRKFVSITWSLPECELIFYNKLLS